MFGIGAGELIVIALVILIAVGPDRMPSLMKTLGKGMRDVRRTTNELRRSTGIDDLLEDTDLRDPLGMNRPMPQKPAMPMQKSAGHPVAPNVKAALLDEEERLLEEQPPIGVDVAVAEERARAAIIARKLAQKPTEPVA